MSCTEPTKGKQSSSARRFTHYVYACESTHPITRYEALLVDLNYGNKVPVCENWRILQT